MTRYMVTYDLRDPGQSYEALKKCIQPYRSHRWLMDSTWGIAFNQTAKDIRDYLDGALDSKDKLLAGPLERQAAWQGLWKKASDWLRENA